ncbi:MAG: RNA methyltransferase [bacterium]|nr:RNA methyltransferase [bacterium]
MVNEIDKNKDPANAGTVFRSAAAFGIDAVAFSGASVRTTNPKFLRGAQDTFLDVDSQNFDSLAELIDSASAAGMNIYLTSSHQAGETVDPADIRLPCLIIFGNEGSGLPDDFLSKYPTIKIAQSGKVESLNAGISACIIMHELHKNMNK